MVTLRGSSARGITMGLIGLFWLAVGPGLPAAEAHNATRPRFKPW